MVNEELTAVTILPLRKNYWSRCRFFAGIQALFMALLLQAGPLQEAEAADASGEFRVFGSGDLPCGRWVIDRRERNPSAVQSEMWVAGYLTAYNQFVFRESDITTPYDGDFLLEWLDSYCRDRPSNELVVAVQQLLEMLRRRR